MDSWQSGVGNPSSDSRDTDEPAPPGIPESEHQLQALDPNKKTSVFQPALSLKGIEIAKKRLRAFSIQKRAPLTPSPVAKASTSSTSNTVLIGKLSSIKPAQPKLEDPDVKKLPKPPKPGKRVSQHGTDSYCDLQKKTLSEIEDMKRKMELVELGIPLGLICPTSAINEKAMPTKAMPPIKSFLDPKKVDEIIREAKKAKAEGKEFKFDYNKLLPDYDNPFQRKKDDETKKEDNKNKYRKSNKYKGKKSKHYGNSYSKRHSSDHKKDDRSRHKDKSSDTDKSSKPCTDTDNANEHAKPAEKEKEVKEADDELLGYVVCDSWSLDNDEKTNSSSPKVGVKDVIPTDTVVNEPIISNEPESLDQIPMPGEDPENDPLLAPKKIERLQPVIDSFKFEIDEPNDDDMMDLYDIPLPKKKRYESPSPQILEDEHSKESMNDGMNDDTFLESIINEIKTEGMVDDDDLSPEKGLVEYEISPPKDFSKDARAGSITPELDDSMRELQFSQRSNYSDGYRSGESGYKSTESGYKSGRSSQSSENYRMSMDKDSEDTMDSKITKATAESLETWSFVMKICQPLLFRHDKNNCYKETRSTPKLWYTEAAKHCHCVKDRMIVYSELDSCKTSLVEALYSCDQILDSPIPTARSWYPQKALESTENATIPVASEWEDDAVFRRREQRVEDKKIGKRAEDQRDEMSLDTEYQRFMESVWPAVDSKADSRSTTPTQEATQMHKDGEDKRRGKKMSSEGWSQESDVEEEEVSRKPKSKEAKRKSRKRKHSVSVSSQSEVDETPKKKKKSDKKKSLQEKKKSRTKASKNKRSEKKKKLKEKHKKKKKSVESLGDDDKENRKKDHKKSKKKKQQKIKKKDAKKKKSKAKSSSSETSSSSSTETSSDSESSAEVKRRKKKNAQSKKRKKDKKRNISSSESAQSEDLFDVNILKNIKKEKEIEDEKSSRKLAEQEFSPRRQVMKRPEIINVKELQNDFVGNNIHIKQEIVEEEAKNCVIEEITEIVAEDSTEKQDLEVIEKEDKSDKSDFKEPQEIPSIKPIQDESNLSQSSSQASQESIVSIKLPTYEKDDSHLRPSSQNSNYSFNDVIASQNAGFNKEDACEENYEPENYDVYEQMALAYQNDVANQQSSAQLETTEQKIETVVRQRIPGEIKCDWRVGDDNIVDPNRPRRPSRWGLKPGEVNIILTGANSHQFKKDDSKDKKEQNVYQIESVLSRTDSSCSMSYDEAYMDTYGELDRLQYGDCFADIPPVPLQENKKEEKTNNSRSSLDERIDLALKNTVLGEVAREEGSAQDDKGAPEKGILVMKSLTDSKGSKSVSFADGYKPGQDSDVEEPPKTKKRVRRYGCPWPCPSTHPDHVSLWDALPPPPPPPGSPPPHPTQAPPPSNMRVPMGQMPMGPPINPQINPPMNSQLRPQMNPQINPQMNPPMNSHLGPQMNPQLGPQMNPPINTQLGPQINPQMNPQLGQMPPLRPLGPQMPMMNNIRMPPDMPIGQIPMNQQMAMNGPPMGMNGPPISLNQQMQINQQIQLINNMRMGQEIPMGQMQMPNQMMQPHPGQFDPSTSLPNFMPPEPPPGLITFN